MLYEVITIFNPINITYFCNFAGASALLVPKEGDNVLYVNSVNYEQAKAEALGVTVELIRREENLMEKIARQASSKRFAVDTLQIEGWRALAKAVGGEEKLEIVSNQIRELRKIKDHAA